MCNEGSLGLLARSLLTFQTLASLSWRPWILVAIELGIQGFSVATWQIKVKTKFISCTHSVRSSSFWLCKILRLYSCNHELLSCVNFSGETTGEIVARLKRDLLPTMGRNLVYWPICDFITLKFIPVHLQVNREVLCSLFWLEGKSLFYHLMLEN